MWSAYVLTLTFTQSLLACNGILKFLLYWRICKQLNGGESWFISAHWKLYYISGIQARYAGVSINYANKLEFYHCSWIQVTSGYYSALSDWGDGSNWPRCCEKPTKGEINERSVNTILIHLRWLWVSFTVVPPVGSCGGNLHCKSGCLVFSLHYRGQSHVYCVKTALRHSGAGWRKRKMDFQEEFSRRQQSIT